MQSAYDIYESTKTQIDGLCAERVALSAQIAGLVGERQAHLQQIAGLLAERQLLRDERDALREINTGLRATLTAARDTLDKWRRAYYGDIPAPSVRVEVSAARDDALDDDGPDAFEDLGGARVWLNDDGAELQPVNGGAQ
jgi:hypothetical protein